MNVLEFLQVNSSRILIVMGSVVILMSIISTSQLIQLLRSTSDELSVRTWKVLIRLLVFFLLGYISVILLMIMGPSFVTTPITGSIFLFGALFVLLVVRFSRRTILQLNEAHSDFTHLQQTNLVATEKLNVAFRKFVPHQFLHLLGAKNLAETTPGDAINTQMTILYCHLHGFRKQSNSTEVADSLRELNQFLNRMVPIIERHGGFVERCIGDAVLAVYPGPPDAALRAALDMRFYLYQYRPYRGGNDGKQMHFGIGIDTGELVLGILGTDKRLQSALIGNIIATTARLGKLTSIYGVPIIFSEATYQKLQQPTQFTIQEIDLVRVRGLQRPIRLFGFFDLTAEDAPGGTAIDIEPQDIYARAIEHFRNKRFEEAQASFQLYNKHAEGDPIVRIYLRRCNQFANRDMQNWKGVMDMTRF